MIYIRIHYGLGNQMFQYALARALAIKTEQPFKLDISFYSHTRTPGEAPRHYGLNVFNIREDVANPEEISKFTQPNFLQRRLRQLEQSIYPIHKRRFIAEEKKPFDERILKVNQTCYLHGYWQSENYFKAVEDQIREDFEFKTEPDDRNKHLLNQIASTDAVCIHIRRGDYLTDQFAVANMEVCSLEYYRKAVDLMASKIDKPNFFVFSDDIVWAKENLGIPGSFTFIDDHNKDCAHEDLRLMNACKHFIIANSSFSWWAAWLGAYSKKIIIGPKNWFRSSENIMPDSWLRI
jgi:hypothetical protein